MRFRARAVLAAAVLVAAFLVVFDVGGVGHGLGILSRPPADPVIDGWVVGARLPDETGYIDVATRLLATTYPGHAAIVRASVHDEGIYYDTDGQQLLWTRSGACCVVVLFELADGSRRAVGAGSVGVDPTVMAFRLGPVFGRPGTPDVP